MRLTQRLKFFGFALLLCILVAGCTQDPDFSRLPVHAHDSFDGIQLEFTDEAGNTKVVKHSLHIHHDHDGDGKDDHGHGEDGELQSYSHRALLLKKNTTYKVKIKLLKLLEGGSSDKLDKVEDVTSLIKDFGDQHLFCFQFKDESKKPIIIERTDVDINGHEVGFETVWKTSYGVNERFMIQLRHQTDKNGEDCSVGATELVGAFYLSIF